MFKNRFWTEYGISATKACEWYWNSYLKKNTWKSDRTKMTVEVNYWCTLYTIKSRYLPHSKRVVNLPSGFLHSSSPFAYFHQYLRHFSYNFLLFFFFISFHPISPLGFSMFFFFLFFCFLQFKPSLLSSVFDCFMNAVVAISY